MKIYVVKIVVHRKDDEITDIFGTYSSHRNALIAIKQDCEFDRTDWDKVTISDNKWKVDVPEEATDGWIYPHTYHIEKHVLDYGIDQDDDENDDD